MPSINEATRLDIVHRQGGRCQNAIRRHIVTTAGASYTCPLAARGGRFDASGYDIDHIREQADGGSDSPGNLQALCVCCHRVKTMRSREQRKHRGAPPQARRRRQRRTKAEKHLLALMNAKRDKELECIMQGGAEAAAHRGAKRPRTADYLVAATINGKYY